MDRLLSDEKFLTRKENALWALEGSTTLKHKDAKPPERRFEKYKPRVQN